MVDSRFSFEKLDVWQRARALVKTTYSILNQFPKNEQYALCDQMRRAVISIPSNIAESGGRVSYKEKAHFLDFALGSAMELYCQYTLAFDLGYIPNEYYEETASEIIEISRMISGLKHKYEINN
jgi:four helix bundle protein